MELQWLLFFGYAPIDNLFGWCEGKADFTGFGPSYIAVDYKKWSLFTSMMV